jgi:hypothetical protein
MTSATLARPRLDPLLDAPLVGPRVLSIVGDESGCSMWRAWQPARFLQLHGYPCDWVHVRDPALIDVPLEGYEAIVLCRLAWHRTDRSRAGKWLDTLRARGRRVFFEADDDLFTPFMVEQQAHRINPEKTRAQLEADRADALWAMGRCDGVTVSTQYLASTVRRYTSAPVEVVPNAIDAGWFLSRQRGVPRPCPNPIIGWAGGNRPDADVEPMAVAWGRVARRYPEVMFLVFGHQPPVVAAHVPDERVMRISWLPSQDYPRGLVGVDVGCCPLEDTPFNRSKTPIKAWELALSGAAVVASPTVYGKVIDQGRTGMLASDAGEWELCLSLLLAVGEAPRELAANLKRDVLERWSLKANYWRWPAAWRRLMEAG